MAFVIAVLSCAVTEIWICGEQLLLRELSWMDMWGMATAVEASAATSPFLQCTRLVQRIGGRTNINSEDVNN